MASPASRPEGPYRGQLRERIVLFLLVFVLLGATVRDAGTSRMRGPCDEDGKDNTLEGKHPDFQDRPQPLESGPGGAEGPPQSRRARRSPQRPNHPDAGQPCLMSSCGSRALPGNLSNKEAMKRHRENSVRDEILRKLRMDHPVPNVTTRERGELTSMRQFFSRYGHDRYPPSADQSADDEYSTPMVLIVQSRTVPRAGFNASSSCYFKFLSSTYQSEQVVTAQLGIYLRGRTEPVPRAGDSIQHLLIKRNRRIGFSQQQSSDRNNRGESYRRKVINASNPNHFDRWHFFEVKTLVQVWINHPERNFGITVSTTDDSLRSLVVVQPRRPDEETLRPFIEVKMRPSSGVRVTRSVGPDCSDDSQERSCCRYPLTIDFDAFRWDWIIAPKRYEAYYCSGECPFIYYQSNPQTHLIQQVAATSIGVPCCSPTHVSPLPLIYMDEKLKRIVYGTIPGMIVDRCGCL